jgi:hypothetical protein
MFVSLHLTDERNGAVVSHGFSDDDWRHGQTSAGIRSGQS